MKTQTKITIILCTLLYGLLSIPSASAGWWRTEVGDVTADFGTVNFSASEDTEETTKTISANDQINGKPVATHCDPGTEIPTTGVKVYSTAVLIPSEQTIADGVTYAKINDYVDAALNYGFDSTYWIPMTNQPIGKSNYQCGTTYNHVGDTKYKVSIRIRKPFVGVTYISELLADIYTGDEEGTAYERGARQGIYLKGTITVPQTCELNTGQTIEFNFGNIPASAFSKAGAGNKAEGVNPQTKDIGIKCKNIDAQALLSLRIEANSVSGNAMISDNEDLGFIVANKDKTPLTPNNIDSKIPFQLDDNAAASVPITAWPVSITGNKPAEGKFTAEGYLRVDFD